MNNNNKKKYIEPEIIETVLECEDIITASASLKKYTGTEAPSSGDFVSVGSASWGSIYNQ